MNVLTRQLNTKVSSRPTLQNTLVGHDLSRDQFQSSDLSANKAPPSFAQMKAFFEPPKKNGSKNESPPGHSDSGPLLVWRRS